MASFGQAGAMHYVDGNLDFLKFSEGRILDPVDTAKFQYSITDHLGNVRVVWNPDGTLDQISDYYPFGMLYNEHPTGGTPVNKYLHQGQEYQEELGWNQFKWRNADPAIGRFFNIDPLAESYTYNSTYAFSENRVVNGIELEGLSWVPVYN